MSSTDKSVLPDIWQLQISHAKKGVASKSADELRHITERAEEVCNQWSMDAERALIATVGGVEKLCIPAMNMSSDSFSRLCKKAGADRRPLTPEERRAYFPESPAIKIKQAIFSYGQSEAEISQESMLKSVFPGVEAPLLFSEVFFACAIVWFKRAEGQVTKKGLNEKGVACLGEASLLMSMASAQIVTNSFDSFSGQVARINGIKGLQTRWSKKDRAEARAVSLWTSGKWSTKTACARSIKDEILQIASKDGLRLKSENIERQIKDWIRASQKNP